MDTGIANILYFCGVKTQLRHRAAAMMQRFLWSILLVNLDTERIKVCGSSNAHRYFAVEILTAPCALVLFNVKYQLL